MLGSRILEEDISRTSVIGTVERRLGLGVTYIEQGIETVRCPKEIAALLVCRMGAPILRFRRPYFMSGADPVEHAGTYHRPERYPYAMMLHRAEQRGR